MMAKTYILDTNIVTYLHQHSSPFHSSVKEKLDNLPHKDKVCLSILFLYEYEYSIALAKEPSILEELEKRKKLFLELFEILPLTRKGAEVFGSIKSKYRKETGIVQKALERHNTDLMLAASAVVENAVLVSNDRIFIHIQKFYPYFLVENWAISKR